MLFSMIWDRWLRRNKSNSSKTKRKRSCRRAGLALEALESRTLLSAEATPLFLVYQPPGAVMPLSSPSPVGLHPSQILKAYGFNQLSFSSNGSPVPADGSGETIAIVDAYNDPNIGTDFADF